MEYTLANRPLVRSDQSRGTFALRAGFALMVGLALVASIPTQVHADDSEYYIRSEKRDGDFNGYQQLKSRKAPGFVRVTYCDRTFWVRPATVLWTETEAEAGRKLTVEESWFNSTEVLCYAPEQQVGVKDLGLNPAELKQLRANNSPLNMKSSRIHVIRDAFKRFK